MYTKLCAIYWRTLKIVVDHKRKFATLLLLASVATLATGIVRLSDYSAPMLLGDYEVAATNKSQAPGQPDDDNLGPLMSKPTIGELIADKCVEANNSYFDWSCGPRELAKFNSGWKRYQDYDFEGARNQLDRAYTACCNEKGVVEPSKRDFASNLQLLIGNCFANRDKTDQAIAAYEQSLTLNPNNIIATYNLERLQDAKKSGGGGKNNTAGGTGRRI